MFKNFWNWLDDRAGIKQPLHNALSDPLPRKVGWAQVLGSGALFLIILQAITGILLAMNYSASPDHAYDSLKYVTDQPFGKLIRGLHHHGSSALIIVVTLHMLRVFVFGAYKKPRELTWMIGILLFCLILGFSFTGYLLPYDQKAYWATKVGIGFVHEVPWLGPYIQRILQGGHSIGPPTLTRFYAIHVLILPALLVPLIFMHLHLMRRKGEMPPWTEEFEEASVRRTVPFYPFQLFRDTVFIALLFLALLLITSHYGVPNESPADTTAKNYLPRPEWYFLPLFEFEKLHINNFYFFGGNRVWIGTVLIPSIFITILLFLPFIDRNPSRLPRNRKLALTSASIVVLFIITLGVKAKVDTENQKSTFSKASAFEGTARLGEELFATKGCYKCHRIDGKGGRIGPEFTPLPENQNRHWTKEQLIFILINPQEALANGQNQVRMPSAQTIGLSLDQVDALADYLTKLKIVE